MSSTHKNPIELFPDLNDTPSITVIDLVQLTKSATLILGRTEYDFSSLHSYIHLNHIEDNTPSVPKYNTFMHFNFNCQNVLYLETEVVCVKA